MIPLTGKAESLDSPGGTFQILALGIVWLALSALPGWAQDSPGGTSEPNVVILLADDLGWADVGFHEGEIRTPHIDRLARGGIRLEGYYVQPICSPTRSSLMTGRYTYRLGTQAEIIETYVPFGVPLRERFLPTGSANERLAAAWAREVSLRCARLLGMGAGLVRCRLTCPLA